MPRLIYALFLPLLLVSFAAADTLSGCTVDPTGGFFVCNFYEEFGPNNEMSPPVQLPWAVASGFWVLLETPGNTDMSNWSDILWFVQGPGGNAIIAQLFSDPLENLPFDPACVFHPYECGYTGATGWIWEYQVPTVIDVGNIYNVYSDVDETEAIPEPASLLLLGTGFVALGGMLRKRLLS